MNFFSGLCFSLVALVLVARPSFQCTCRFLWNMANNEKVPSTLCYDDQTYIVFKADEKVIIPGDVNTERVQFKVTVNTVITRAGGEEDIPGGRKITLDAPTGGHLCGYIDFELGVSGILAVYGPLQDTINYNACHFYRKETEVTSVQRQLMSGNLSCLFGEPADDFELVE